MKAAYARRASSIPADWAEADVVGETVTGTLDDVDDSDARVEDRVGVAPPPDPEQPATTTAAQAPATAVAKRP